jgi:YbbR domain-containing protein
MGNRFVRWLRDLFVANFGLKVLALVLATITFHAISGVTNFEVTFDVPVVVEVAKGLAILDQDPRMVRVTCRGSREDLGRITAGDLQAVIQVAPTNASGSEQVLLRKENVIGNRRARVVHIRPETVTVSFDHEVEKKFPVARPRTVGKPLVGKVEVDYEPRFVTIRGPDRRLKLKEVFTEPVDVDGRVDSFTKKVRVLSGDDWITDIEPSEITVRVNIVTESATRQLTNVTVMAVVRQDQSVQTLVIEPRMVKVSLHGGAEMLDGIPDAAVKAFVDCAGLERAATYELPVNVHYPASRDVNAIVEPETVKVTLGTP